MIPDELFRPIAQRFRASSVVTARVAADLVELKMRSVESPRHAGDELLNPQPAIDVEFMRST